MEEVTAISIKMPTDDIERGIKKLEELSKQGPKVEQSMAGISAESKKVARSLADLGSGAGDDLKKTGEAAQKAATGIKASGTAAREAVTNAASLARAMASLTAEEEKHIRKLVDEANGLRMSRGEMEAYKAAQKGLGAGAQEAAKAIEYRITALKEEQNAMAALNSAHNNVSDGANKIAASMKGVDLAMDKVLGTALRLGGVTSVEAAIWDVIGSADEWSQYASRIKLATNSAAEYAAVSERMIQSATTTFRSINETKEAFINLSPILRSTGLNLEQSMDAIDAFSGLLVINSASADKGAAAMSAYSKSLQKGKIDAMSWATLISAMPSVVDLIAESTGKTAEKIRELGASGDLAVSELSRTLVDKFVPVMDRVKEMPTTVKDALTNMGSVFSEYVGKLNDSAKATQILVKGINEVSENFSSIAKAAALVATVFASRLVGSIAASSLAFATSTIQAVRLQASMVSLASAISGTSVVAVAGMGAMTAAARLAGTAMAALGGIPGLLFAATSAFFILRDSTKEVSESLIDLSQPLDDVIKKFSELTRAQQQSEIIKAIEAQASAIKKQSDAYATLRDAMSQGHAGYALLNEMDAAYASGGDLSIFVEKLRAVSTNAKNEIFGLAAAVDTQRASAKAATDVVGELKSAWESLTGAIKDNTNAKSLNASADGVIGEDAKKQIERLDKQIALFGKKGSAAGMQYDLDNNSELSANEKREIQRRIDILALKEKSAESSRVAGAAYKSEATEAAKLTKTLLEKLAIEKSLGQAMSARGLAASSMSDAEKSVVKLQEKLNTNLSARSKLEVESQLATAQKTVAQENSNKALKDALMISQKTIDSSQSELTALQDQIKFFGLKEDAVLRLKEAEAQADVDRAKQNNASAAEIAALEKILSLRKQITEEAGKLDFEKQSKLLSDSLKSIEDEIKLRQYGFSLLGMEETKRQKLLVIRKSELALEKEIAEIRNKSYSNDPTENELRKADLINKAILNSKTNLQAELGRIQEQAITEQVQKYDQICSQGFADMFNRGKDGWKSFTKSLTTTFKNQVADQIYKMLARPFVVRLVAAFMGGGFGSAASAASGGLSAGSSMLGAASAASSMWKAVSGGMNAAASLGKSMLNAEWFSNLGNEAMKEMLGQFGAGMMNTASWAAATQAAQAGGAQLAGLVAGSLLNGFAGYGISKFLSGGYSAGGWVNTAAGIASMIPGIGPIAGVVGAIINRAFGRKLKDAGIEGEFGGETGFEGRQFEFYKGGWFRSDKTKYKDLEESTRSGFADQYTVLKKSVEAMGESLGFGAGFLDDFSYKMKLSLKGLSEEDAAKRIQEEFDKIAESMAGVILTTDEYAKADETRIDTLVRLSTSLASANEWFKTVGDTLYDVSLAGADMASELMDAFGGADKFVAATSNYYDKFFSDQEKVANQTRLLDEQLKALGVETMPAGREAFRAYLDGIDKTTEEGQKLYAALIGLADAFDLIYTSAEHILGLKQDLDMQLLHVQGRDDEAQKLERERTLAELSKYNDPELIAKQQAVWDAQDANKAKSEAQDLAMSGLNAAISREKEYWSQFTNDAKDALTKASSYWSLVTGAASSLRDSLDDVTGMQAAAGMVYIEQALENARRGMGLSDYDKTKDAISAATGGLVMDNYASKAELDYDKKVLAGQLGELGDYAELAKSDAQKQIDIGNAQIKRLDETLKFWQDFGKDQIDATLSVTDAIKALEKLMFPEEDSQPGGAGSKGGPVFGGTVSGSKPRSTVVGLTADGRPIYSDGTIGEYAAGEHAYNENGNKISNGYSEDEFKHWTSNGDFEWDDASQTWKKRNSFAVGTNYVPHDMVENIHPGERIVPAADNRALMTALNSGGAGSSAMHEVVAELRAVNQRLQAIESGQGDVVVNTRKAATVLSNVTDGGNAMRNQSVVE